MYLSLVQYEEDAIKTIKKYMGSKYITDDNVGFVMYYMMKADEKFNESLGFKRSTYRVCYGRYACLKLFNQYKNPKKTVNIQNWELENTKNEFNSTDDADEIKVLIDKANLDNNEKIAFELLMQGYAYKDMAVVLKVSKQRVGQIISNIKKKVQ